MSPRSGRVGQPHLVRVALLGEKQLAVMSEHGASYLLYLASDAVVDGCFPVLDALGDEIDELEEAVVGGGRRRTGCTGSLP